MHKLYIRPHTRATHTAAQWAIEQRLFDRWRRQLHRYSMWVLHSTRPIYISIRFDCFKCGPCVCVLEREMVKNRCVQSAKQTKLLAFCLIPSFCDDDDYVFWLPFPPLPRMRDWSKCWTLTQYSEIPIAYLLVRHLRWGAVCLPSPNKRQLPFMPNMIAFNYSLNVLSSLNHIIENT